jgi:hypothetical protein
MISEEIARQAEKANELLRILAVTTFSARKNYIAGTDCRIQRPDRRGQTMARRELRTLSDPNRVELSPATVGISQEMLSHLDDRRDGVALLAEALANTHETGRSCGATPY